jgi:hypothetical protein
VKDAVSEPRVVQPLGRATPVPSLSNPGFAGAGAAASETVLVALTARTKNKELNWCEFFI